jgi:hypothetical protein
LQKFCSKRRHARSDYFLAPGYGWFTEGFDTPDLKQAKALLDELASVADFGLPETGAVETASKESCCWASLPRAFRRRARRASH